MSGPVAIRRAQPAPAEAAAALHKNLVGAGQALSADATPSFMIIAEDDAGAMRGACKGEIAFRSAHVSELWVSEAARGQGLGRKLLADSEALAREEGCTRVHLETRNPKARALYEAWGYRVFGELPDYDGDISFWYLTKDLSS